MHSTPLCIFIVFCKQEIKKVSLSAGDIGPDLETEADVGQDLEPTGGVGQDLEPAGGIGRDLESAEGGVGRELEPAGGVGQDLECWTRTDHPTLFPTCRRDTSTSVRTRLGMQLNIPTRGGV